MNLLRIKVFLILLFTVVTLFSITLNSAKYDHSFINTRNNIIKDEDTTYFPQNNAIHSIKFYENERLSKISFYFCNGDLNYYVKYTYLDDVLRKVEIYDKDNKLKEFGWYSGTDDLKYTYTHFIVDSTKLWEILFDADWKKIKYTKFTLSDKIRFYTNYTYENELLKKEESFNHDDVLYSKVKWKRESESVKYTFTCKNNTVLENEHTNIKHNSYTIMYSDTLNPADSMVAFMDDDKVFTKHYSYNENNWVTKETYTDKSGKEFAKSTYEFDKNKFETLHSFFTIPDTSGKKEFYNYNNKITFSKHYYQSLKIYSQKYSYDNMDLLKKVDKLNAFDKIVLQKNYKYYDIYNFIKEFTEENLIKGILFKCTYDKYGDISDSGTITSLINNKSKKLVNNKISIYRNKNSLILSFPCNTMDKISIDLFTIDGKKIFQQLKKVKYRNEKSAIDITIFTPGVYFIVVRQNTQFFRKKIIL